MFEAVWWGLGWGFIVGGVAVILIATITHNKEIWK